MSKGAKNPNRTGMRCLLCYAYEIHDEQDKKKVKIEHEESCPDNRR